MAGATLEDAPAAGQTRYEDDFYIWAQEQADLLRTGQAGALDFANLAEEIADVGDAQYHRLESALRVLLMHMLKWDHQAERRTRSWDNAIEAQRRAYRNVLVDNPGLKSRRTVALERAYAPARLDASSETGLPRKAFPETCPYGWDDILARPFDFDSLKV